MTDRIAELRTELERSLKWHANDLAGELEALSKDLAHKASAVRADPKTLEVYSTGILQAWGSRIDTRAARISHIRDTLRWLDGDPTANI